MSYYFSLFRVINEKTLSVCVCEAKRIETQGKAKRKHSIRTPPRFNWSLFKMETCFFTCILCAHAHAFRTQIITSRFVKYNENLATFFLSLFFLRMNVVWWNAKADSTFLKYFYCSLTLEQKTFTQIAFCAIQFLYTFIVVIFGSVAVFRTQSLLLPCCGGFRIKPVSPITAYNEIHCRNVAISVYLCIISAHYLVCQKLKNKLFLLPGVILARWFESANKKKGSQPNTKINWSLNVT